VNATTRNSVVRSWVGMDALTAIVDDHLQTVQVYSDLRDIWEALRQDGNRVNPFKVHRYYGHGCGPLRIGTDGVSTLVQVTGPLANSVAVVMAQYDLRATRVDIQATFELSSPYPENGEWCYTHWELARAGGVHKRANKLVKSSTGTTAYTGSRKGDRTFRVYDKSVELGAAMGTFWRYEVEYHADKAGGVWLGWKHARDEVEWMKGHLLSAFRAVELELPLSSGDKGSAMATPGNLRSVERYLKWFETSVQPVVRDLRNKVPDAILTEALGLQGTLPNLVSDKENDNGGD